MKIAIDLRSLSSGTISGVENYCLNLLENLLPLDKQNKYILFYNSFRQKQLPDFHYVNSQVRHTRMPSKLLNLALKFNMIKLEKLVGEVDWLFMPNLNQFSINGKTKLAIVVHDLSPVLTPEFYDIKRRVWHKFLNYKSAFERANILFAVSEYTKNDLVRVFKINPEKIKVVYPATNLNANSHELALENLRAARNVYGLPGEYILFLNTIEPRKNLAGVIKAFEMYSGPESLVIAGRLGWKYKKDFQLIKSSKKFAKIKYIGYVSENHKSAIIKLARTLIYPSYYEGFGFQPLEAMAVGTPVIVSQLTSLPEVVGDAGLFINPYDINSVAESLNIVLNNGNLRAQLIEKGLERVKKFNWRDTAQGILSSLQS